MVPRLRARLAVLAGLALAAAACTAPAPRPSVEDFRIVDSYASLRPVDVGVPAVAGSAPAAMAALVREAARAALLERDYAPVRASEVDRDPGAFRPGGPNAVLEVRLAGWDETRLYTDGAVRVEAEARLFRAGSADALYVARLESFDARAHAVPVYPDGGAEARREIATRVARKLLERLPPKGDG